MPEDPYPNEPIDADPLPPEIEEGDSADTDYWDDTDTPAHENPPGAKT